MWFCCHWIFLSCCLFGLCADFCSMQGGSEYIICKWQLQHSNIELIDGVESVLEKGWYSLSLKAEWYSFCFVPLFICVFVCIWFLSAGPNAIMIDLMVFHAVFQQYSLTSQQPVHRSMLSWSSFNKYSAQNSFQATGCFPSQNKGQWWERNESCCNGDHQFLERILAERGIELLFSSPQRYWLSYGAWQMQLWNFTLLRCYTVLPFMIEFLVTQN